MQLVVKQFGGTAVMDEDGLFHCAHDNVMVEPPCCDGSPDEYGRNTCDCSGQYSVYCPDCRNKDLDEQQVEQVLNSHPND